MISTEEAKQYLRIPYNDDDQFLESIIEAGYAYLRDAVDDFDAIYAQNETFSIKADLWVKTMWLPEAYDNREGMTAGNPSMGYVSRALITQLSLYKVSE